VGFAPASNPQIIVGSIMEFAEHGSSVAPYVIKVLRRFVLGPDPRGSLTDPSGRPG
jgi:cell division protein FtsI/penicillin-binding protein 2